VTIWDMSAVEVWCTLSFIHVLIIKGRMLLTGQEFIIAIIYAPCESTAKEALWVCFSEFILNHGDANFCICGDFNYVRLEDERRGRCVIFRQGDAENFNNFIGGCILIYLLICGRHFIWYRGDGISMSRLDRFLLSANWCESWPNCIEVAHQEGFQIMFRCCFMLRMQTGDLDRCG